MCQLIFVRIVVASVNIVTFFFSSPTQDLECVTPIICGIITKREKSILTLSAIHEYLEYWKRFLFLYFLILLVDCLRKILVCNPEKKKYVSLISQMSDQKGISPLNNITS